jgi:polyhydroxyalkanoate synthesis regulator phasin
MNENRRQILEMLSAGKINADEAERLLAALEDPTPASGTFTGSVPSKTKAKYLRVLVEASEKGAPTTVNVRVPMQLLYAGVRLASLIPAKAHEQLDEALSKHGVPLTVSQIKPENLEELIDHLQDLTVDVDSNGDEEKAKVRVFCE